MNIHESPFTGITAANDYRVHLAQMLARSCPVSLGQSIAVTGSSARGLADDDSDLEVNFWVNAIPGHDQRLDWLISMGLRDPVVHFKPRADQSVWISGHFHGIALEAGWQTFTALEQSLTPILAGEAFDRKPLTLAELIASAVVLRDDGQLELWQGRLKRHYPAALRAQLYEDALKRLNDTGHLTEEQRLAKRGETLVLVEMLRDDLAVMMRLLYAINGRWEAGPKWTLTLAENLTIMPQNWRERMDTVFASPHAAAIEQCRALLAEALALAHPPE